MLRFVDLFAGCGGLSLGLRAAGSVEVLAVERAEGAARTFHHNLIGPDSGFKAFQRLSTTEQIERGLLINGVEELVASKWRPQPQIDVVVGGPPCQGFSLAGRRDSKDTRNDLVWTFLKVVKQMNPLFVVIENVEGMNHKFSNDEGEVVESSTFAQVLTALELTGYVANGIGVNAKHYGAAQHRPRLMAIGIRKDVAKTLGIAKSEKLWRSTFLSDEAMVPRYAPMPTVASARSVKDAIGDLFLANPAKVQSGYLKELRDAKRWHLGRQEPLLQNHELRSHRGPTIERFQVLQALASLGADQRILGPMSTEAREKALKRLSVLAKARPEAFASVAESEAAFLELIERLVNNKHSQRVLSWASPAPTVMTIPDDHIHPAEPRTFSVREMARFQGFPDAFVFKGKATTGGTARRLEVPQYSQVGNAVSPYVAKAVGLRLEALAAEYRDRVGKRPRP